MSVERHPRRGARARESSRSRREPRRLVPKRPLRLSPAEISGSAPLLGAHVSVAGGMPNAFVRALELACGAMQVFVKSQQQWRGRHLGADEADAFHAARSGTRVRWTMAHAAYLVNLASPNDVLLERSRLAMLDEMQRCARLGIDALVVHPGAHMGSGEADGLRRIAEALRWLLQQPGCEGVSLLLECTAGQGSCLGHRFEQLARALEDAGGSSRLGVCIDTCHLLAAGYEIRTDEGYEQVWRQVEATIGLARVRAFHLNDSKTPLGSRVDRHAEIGAGFIGKPVFARLLHDPRFAGLPMVLETPGGQEGYRRNLRVLRRLLAADGRAPEPASIR